MRGDGRHFTKPAGTTDRKQAERVKVRVEDMPSRLKSGYAALPDGPDPGEFIVSGERTCQVLRAAVPLVSRPLTLGDLFRLHGEHFPADGKAKTAQVLEQIHKGQLLSGFGPEATLDSLGTASAQRW